MTRTTSSLVLAPAAEIVSSSDARLGCLAVLSEHSKSFALAGRLLTREARRDAAALYTWCRYADDLIDLSSPERRPALLVRLERELISVYAGELQRTLPLQALSEVSSTRQIPLQYPSELLAGMRMDVEGTRYETLDQLLLYCHRVAGVVGLMMSHVLGVADARALRHAAHLGIAMQLTNVCRDVAEDWERGRLYLPDELLSVDGLHAHLGRELPDAARPAIAGAVERLLAIADRFYASADLGLPALDVQSAFAIRTARLVYSRIGREIAARDYDVLSGRVVVPRSRKLFLALRAAFTTFCAPHRHARREAMLRTLPTRRYPDDVLPL